MSKKRSRTSAAKAKAQKIVSFIADRAEELEAKRATDRVLQVQVHTTIGLARSEIEIHYAAENAPRTKIKKKLGSTSLTAVLSIDHYNSKVSIEVHEMFHINGNVIFAFEERSIHGLRGKELRRSLRESFEDSTKIGRVDHLIEFLDSLVMR